MANSYQTLAHKTSNAPLVNQDTHITCYYQIGPQFLEVSSEQWIGISCRPDRLLSENITESGKQYGYESGDRRVSVLFPEKGTSRVF
jgi:hypothetical protein